MPPRSNGSVRSHHSGHSADKATKKAGSNGINAESVQGKERAPVAASSSDGSSEASTSRAPSDVEGSDGGTEGGHDGEDDGMSGSEASSSDEEDDDEDEEPTLRYSRITRKATSDIFARDSCSALAVSDTYLVVGTHNGGVVVFARPGGPAVTAAAGTNSKGKGKERQLSTASVLEEVEEGSIVIKRYRPHTASINDIVIDEDSQYIGTAATDGRLKEQPTLRTPVDLVVLFRQDCHPTPGDLRRPAIRPETTHPMSSSRALVCDQVHPSIRIWRNGRIAYTA